MWDQPSDYNTEAKWQKKVEEDLVRIDTQQNIAFVKIDVVRQLLKMPNWKSQGQDVIHGFWLKILTSLHQVTVDVLHRSVQTANIAEWALESRTVVIQKDASKGNVVGNYRPIACLNLIWKLLTGIIAEKLYEHLHKQILLPDEQKIR